MDTFDFSKAVILRDNHVLLRPLEAGDLEYLLEFSLNEPETWTYSLVNAAGKENLEAYINAALEGRKQQKEYAFIVYDQINGQYAGTTRFYDIQLFNKTLQLGYTWYGKKFRGTGVNKHSKFLLLDYAFNTLQIERVEFRADNRNEKSIAAMKSIGCTVEGVLRSNAITAEGIRRDSIVLSILRTEWNRELRARLFVKTYGK
ncbi:MAG TPA: GNAT family protein [Bacteroidia bacterium]|nr:GNAT family protein [Bacteroidia bacterium]